MKNKIEFLQDIRFFYLTVSYFLFIIVLVLSRPVFASLAIIPAVLSAHFWGVRGGIVNATIICVLLFFILGTVHDRTFMNVMPAYTMIFFLSLISGYFRDRENAYQQELEKLNETIQENFHIEKLLANISSQFVTVENLNQAVEFAIKELALYCNSQRSYAILINNTTNSIEEMIQWESDSTSTKALGKHILQKIIIKNSFNTLENSLILKKDHALNFLQDKTSVEEILTKYKLTSICIFPIAEKKEQLGIVILENPSLNTYNILKKHNAFKIISENMTSTILRRNAEKNLILSRNQAELYLDILGHDIGNINQGILSYLEISINNDNLDEITKKHLTDAMQQSKEMNELTQKVAKLSKLEQCKTMEKIDIIPLLKKAILQLHSIYPDKDIVINKQFHIETANIKTNELIFDVFINIFSNAVKYNRNKQILIDIIAYESKNGKNIVIECKDRGRGISDPLKQKVFKRLERGENSVSGTGLGLAIVKSVVTICGGTVHIEDRVKDDYTLGANIIISLPKAI